MEEISLWFLLWAALLLFANALFVSAEFSLVALRRTKIEELIHQGSRAAAHVKQLLEHLDECLSTCQVGITLASLGLGWIGERAFAVIFFSVFETLSLPRAIEWFHLPGETGAAVTAHAVAAVLAFILITFLHVTMGEQAPKVFALRFPERLALWIVWPMRLANWVFYPLVWLVNKTSHALLKAAGVQPELPHARVHSVEELGLILDESRLAGVVSPDERKMLERVFRFHDKTVKEIMVPRLDIVALSIRAGEEEVTKAFFESGYSRLPVYDGGLDKIVGILYVKDLLYTMQHPQLIKVVDLVREAPEIPETCPLSQLLREFQKRRVHMAILVDEFGTTVGLVTLEDLLEEIVGEIRDEHDQEADPVERLPDGTALVDGLLHVDRFREAFPDVEVPEGDFDTVGGLVLHLARRLPREGDSFRLGELGLRVVKREGRRVRKVAVRRLGPGGPAPSGSSREPGAAEALARSLRDEAATAHDPPSGETPR
jgi:CBS domain containing-hemolysin-like protein